VGALDELQDEGTEEGRGPVSALDSRWPADVRRLGFDPSRGWAVRFAVRWISFEVLSVGMTRT
jgi:hypothetical protein